VWGRRWQLVIAVIAALLVLSTVVIIVYDGLAGACQCVREGWNAIDVQLKRRASLIPNLVEAVRGYADYERGTMERIAEARGALGRAGGPGAAARQRALRPASAGSGGHRK